MCILACRRLDVLRWLRSPVNPKTFGLTGLPRHLCLGDPCPARFSSSMSKAAAAQGDIEMLTWLRSQGCPWGTASRSALKEVQLDTLFWMLSQDPPCGWYGPSMDMAEEDLEAVIKAAAWTESELMDKPKAIFLDKLVISCLKAHKHLSGLPMDMDQAKLVAESGRVAPMEWLLRRLPRHEPPDEEACMRLLIAAAACNHVPMLELVADFLDDFLTSFDEYFLSPCPLNGTLVRHQLEDVCTAAATHGALAALKWLRSREIPFPWSCHCSAAAAAHNQVPVLEWMLAEAPDGFWNESCCIQAVENCHLEALKWLRSPAVGCPCPDNICTLAADAKWVEGFRWLRSSAHHPAYTWSQHDAASNLDLVVASGDNEHLDALEKPRNINGLVDLCKIAAEYGQLKMLSWLLSGENSSAKIPASVCQRAAEYDQAEIVQYLMTRRVPRAQFPKRPNKASDRCFIILARDGCPIADSRGTRRRLRRLVNTYYVLEGLLKYARLKTSVNDGCGKSNDATPFDPDATRRARLPLIQHNAEGCKLFNSLLVFDQLPDDVLKMIRDNVCISPEDAQNLNLIK